MNKFTKSDLIKYEELRELFDERLKNALKLTEELKSGKPYYEGSIESIRKHDETYTVYTGGNNDY